MSLRNSRGYSRGYLSSRGFVALVQKAGGLKHSILTRIGESVDHYRELED